MTYRYFDLNENVDRHNFRYSLKYSYKNIIVVVKDWGKISFLGKEEYGS